MNNLVIWKTSLFALPGEWKTRCKKKKKKTKEKEAFFAADNEGNIKYKLVLNENSNQERKSFLHNYKLKWKTKSQEITFQKNLFLKMLKKETQEEKSEINKPLGGGLIAMSLPIFLLRGKNFPALLFPSSPIGSSRRPFPIAQSCIISNSLTFGGRKKNRTFRREKDNEMGFPPYLFFFYNPASFCRRGPKSDSRNFSRNSPKTISTGLLQFFIFFVPSAIFRTNATFKMVPVFFFLTNFLVTSHISHLI